MYLCNKIILKMSVELLDNKLTNAQIEILNLMAINLEEFELKKLKQLIINFKAERITAMADKHWDDKNSNPDELMNEKLRLNQE